MTGLTENNGWFHPRDRLPPPQHIVQVVYDDCVTSARLLAFREATDWVDWKSGMVLDEHCIAAWAERGDT